MKVNNILPVMAFFVIAIIAYSCTEKDNGVGNAVPKTKESIENMYGLEWYQQTKKMYHPDTSIIKQIIEEFDPARDRFILFSSLNACSCNDENKLFPQALKVFDTSGIDSLHYELYVVRNNKTIHPYMNLFSLYFIPSMILLIDGKPVYSVIDSVITNTKDYKIEAEILKALMKN